MMNLTTLLITNIRFRNQLHVTWAKCNQRSGFAACRVHPAMQTCALLPFHVCQDTGNQLEDKTEMNWRVWNLILTERITEVVRPATVQLLLHGQPGFPSLNPRLIRVLGFLAGRQVAD